MTAINVIEYKEIQKNLQFSIPKIKSSNIVYKFNDMNIRNKDLYGYFITVSPSHNDDIKSIINLLTKCATKIRGLKGVSEYFYVYEQLDPTYDPHLHILVKRKPGDSCGAPKKLKDTIINICDKIFTVKCHIEIKHVEWNSENDYINNMKKTDSKYNKEFKEKFNLKTYYSGR